MTVESMASSYLEILRSVWPRGPYLLGGYCNAGLIAFEMARQLRACGERVDLLVIIDIRAKNADFRILRGLVRFCSRIFQLDPVEELEFFIRIRNFMIGYKSLSGWDRAKFAVEKGRRFKQRVWKVARKRFSWSVPRRPKLAAPDAGKPVCADPGWVDRSPHYRRMINGYVVRPYSGPITLLRTNDHVELENDPTLGWSHITSDLTIHTIPGDHLSCVIDREHLAALGDRLNTCLERSFAAIESQKGSRGGCDTP